MFIDVGRPELRKFVVAVRERDRFPTPDDSCPDKLRWWPAEFDAALERARELYCTGTHEMVQGRVDGLVIQYLIPRKKRTEARPFPLAWAA